jgi:hypothetical protein
MVRGKCVLTADLLSGGRWRSSDSFDWEIFKINKVGWGYISGRLFA